jgi:hypothetical protein
MDKIESLQINKNNIATILEQNKIRSAEIAKKRDTAFITAGTVAGGAIGFAFFGVGATVGAPVGAAIGKAMSIVTSNILPKKSIWSKLDGSDKVNLIEGLVLESVWVKGKMNHEDIKRDVLITLVDNRIILKKDEEVNRFFPSNEWALNRVVSESKKAKDLQELVISMQNTFDTEVSMYQGAERMAIAKNAIAKAKQGKPITELEAIKILEQQEATKIRSAIDKAKGRA